MDEDFEGCTTAEDVLRRLRSFGIGIKSVTNALGNAVLMDHLMATRNGRTLLHMAAQANSVSVLLAVVQVYRRAGLLGAALGTSDGEGPENGALPLHVAVANANYENTVLLLKECREHSSTSLTATTSGATLLHLAASRPEAVSIVKYLLREYRDVCDPMLLAKNSQGATPLQVAGGAKFTAEFSLANAEAFAKTIAGNICPTIQKKVREQQTERPRRLLEQAKEIVNLLGEPTMQARTAEAERQTRLREEQQLREKAIKIAEELTSLLQNKQWDAVMRDYVLSLCEHVQKLSLKFLASVVSDPEAAVVLPPLTAELMQVLKKFIGREEDEPVLKSSLTLLAEFSHEKENTGLFLRDEGVMSLVLKHLRSLQTDLQYLCVSILLHISVSTDDRCLPGEWKQPLLLLKNFSADQEVKRLAREALEVLGASSEVPDPGSWSTADVCFWMEGNTGLERRREFVKAFRYADISGLHLLELSPTEMAGLGVKFVSDQRSLSSLIDDLRRLNMRSVVGRKDMFLSYAHINVQFALQIKRALNEGGYSVWIDTAGIRAGQNWRTEIAHGIHDCRLFVFIMTPRSTNSQYCHDELSLAEEYKKPIVTVKYQQSEEMDPGLKLVIQRRQWMDFSDSSQFPDSCAKLLEAVGRLIGPGSGPEGEHEQQGQEHKHTTQSLVAGGGSPDTELLMRGALSADEVRELVARATAELVGTIRDLEAQVSELSSRVAALENEQ